MQSTLLLLWEGGQSSMSQCCIPSLHLEEAAEAAVAAPMLAHWILNGRLALGGGGQWLLGKALGPGVTVQLANLALASTEIPYGCQCMF